MVSTVVCVMTVCAGPAMACLPYPPPNWSNVLRVGGPPVLIGRVVSVTANAELQESSLLEVEEATASIDAIEWLQSSGPNVVEYVAATEVRAIPGVQNYGWCGRMMTIEPGEVVVVVWATPDRIQVFQASDLPIDWRARVESYQ